MINLIKDQAQEKMSKAVAALEADYAKLRTGRAHPSLLDQIVVDYYGAATPLKQMANVVVEDSRSLTVSPWDKSAMAAVEKAIRISDLDLNPATQGDLIRVPLPALTKERRKDLVRVVKTEAESAKVSVRNNRRDANAALKQLLKDKEISEDDDRRAQAEIQKITDEVIKKIELIAESKEHDLLTV